MDNEFLMLCHKDTKRIGLCGNLVSEKLDGQRCFWDGGISVGMKIKDIPWANKYDARKQEWVSNGLWSRLGNKIHAPSNWLNQLPTGILLDGELWAGYEHRQYLMTTIKTEDGTTDWRNVRYMVYDTPPAKRMFSERIVNYSGRKLHIHGAMGYSDKVLATVPYGAGFAQRHAWLDGYKFWNNVCVLHQQYLIPNGIPNAKAFMERRLQAVLEAGGEGLVVKGAGSMYECARSHGCIKIKPFEDAEGTVVGWVSGKETEKGSRLIGMMGSLLIKTDNGKLLNLSGFTDEERTLSTAATQWAVANPGAEAPPDIRIAVLAFPLGSRLSFKYRGLTADGIPMEARYWRKREDE